MQWERLAVIIALLISIVNGILALFIYQRRRQPGAKSFLGLMIAVMLYAFGYALELTGTTVAQVKLWLDVEYLGIAFIPFFWIAIVADYTGLEGRLKPLISTFLFSFSLLNLIMYCSNDLHHLFYSQLILEKHDAFTVAAFHRELWYWLNLAYMALSIFAGDIIFSQIKERVLPLFQKQINLLIIGSLIPWLGYILFILGVSPWGLDLNPFSFSLTGFVVAVGLFRYQLFELSPIARDKIFDTMRDGVLILDLQNRVADFNNAARNMLAVLNGASLGESASEVFQKYPAIQNQVLKDLGVIELDICHGTSRRYINSRLTLAQSGQDETIGKIITLSDITEEKQAQAYLVHAEKVAVLGKLAADITQELNTPLMAIKATAGEIEGSFDTLWHQIPAFFNGISEHRQQLFLKIFAQLREIPCLTTREERDSLRKLSAILQEQGLEGSFDIVRHFVKLGLAEDFVQFIPLLTDDRDAALLELILTIALQRRDARTIIQAEERTVKIVYALKSFSQLPDPDAEQPVLTDIQAGVEMVLRMYGNLMKNGITTMTNFQKVPAIKAYPDELQQVWTNLIYNAIQAIEGKGELMIEIEQDGDEIIVSFTDNGPGIPVDIIPRIFEPLFTTKKVGEGTGIGLNICKKIVEHHHGKINVQSKPGQTQFWVCLPVNH
ncbi:MAG TPA: hypothetical protein DDW65_24895 [Firmicutes bacterium]|jgi:signal transduction histidine kinase|nr:hypothetical protein [Bacillota bacterium]